MGIIRGICISDIRGIQKSEVQEADIEVDWGIVGDAHRGEMAPSDQSAFVGAHSGIS